MTDKQDQQVQTAIRLPETLLDRVDKVAKRMSEPGFTVTRSDIIRQAIFIGVERLETEKKKR